MNVGWKPGSASMIGVRLVTKLSKCLWYIDPHWDKLVSRGVHMPVRSATFRGYNHFRQQKRKVTQLCSSVLNDHIQELSGLVMQPWFALDVFNELRNDIEQLADCLKVYEDYLIAQSCKVGEHHQIVTVQGSQDDNISLETMLSYDVPVLEEYYTLHQLLLATSFYQPIFLNDLAPRERYDRRKWLSGIQLPFPIMLYRFAYGNHLGTLCYAWKIPDDKSVANAAVSRVYSQLSKEQSTYSTRAMRREFLDHYTTLANVSPMVLRNIYKTLLHDSSSASNSFEKGVDERVAKAILEMDDPGIILDLRQTNGHVESSRFDSFWNKLQCYFDEITLPVHERRHGNTLHMPLAISVSNLCEIITARLQDKYPECMPAVPSKSWVRLQFWPANPYTERAIRYTGLFNVKFGIQVRQIRKEHSDSHYVNSLLQYVKHFSVHHRSILTYVSVDDKAVVPVGGPDCYISTGVCGHNHSLVPLNGHQLQALDHDFHLFGIVPSVAFFIDVPDNASDSFFRGATFVTNKDKVTQPSCALRHSAEMSSLIRLNYDGMVASKPVLVIVSDGGPDHRVTFGSVQVASLSLFCSLDLDMLVCVRTCPYQSWTNVAERIMSTLNLALQMYL